MDPSSARRIIGPGPLALPVSSLVVPGIAALLGSLFLARRPGGLVQALPVLLAAVVTVLPAFHSVTVDEPFPQLAAAGSDILVGRETGPPSGVVGRAGLHGIDHRASGDVLLAFGAEGSKVVRLERLDVEPGPDYQVDLVPGSIPDPSGGVRLDHLRGNRGNQNYSVPATAASTVRPVTVLIWCRAFGVLVAAATI